jgi:hypothetical protein
MRTCLVPTQMTTRISSEKHRASTAQSHDKDLMISVYPLAVVTARKVSRPFGTFLHAVTIFIPRSQILQP